MKKLKVDSELKLIGLTLDISARFWTGVDRVLMKTDSCWDNLIISINKDCLLI